MDVKFLKGTIDDYWKLQDTADEGTFYLATPTQEEREGHNRLFLGKVEITADTQIQSLIEQMNTTIGHLSDLNTTEKKTIVGAINEIVKEIGDTSSLGEEKSVVDVLTELKTAVEKDKTALTVTVEDTTASTGVAFHKQYTIKQGDSNVETTIDIDKITLTPTDDGENGAKKYTLKQGQTEIGHIDIPKDLVVQSGSVTVEDGTTYIVLKLNDETKSEIKIDAKTLVDVYKAAESADEVQLEVSGDTSGHTISAKLVNGGITLVKLAQEVKDHFVERVVSGGKGTATVSNDPTGGILKFETSDGKESGVAVNNGSKDIYAQLYAKEKESGQGARVTLSADKAYYTKGNSPTGFTDSDELLTVKDISDIKKSLTWEPFPTE